MDEGGVHGGNLTEKVLSECLHREGKREVESSWDTYFRERWVSSLQGDLNFCLMGLSLAPALSFGVKERLALPPPHPPCFCFNQRATF